ncbi:MAG: hypothetical protein GF308_13370 [Candidatus Heimdallarchaeota archaeon]|nr:hypothetical protein [Candidatus Heimdallarchaeota archaeon]
MKQDNSQLEEFRTFLLEKELPEEKVASYLKGVRGFIQFLEDKNESIFSFTSGKLIEYADQLVSRDKEAAVSLVLGLWNYFPYIGKYQYLEELIDIAESASAMGNLYKRIADWHGEEIRDEIFKDIAIPPLGARPEKKPPVTREVMKRLEEKLGEEKTVELLRPCLHGRPGDDSKDKETFLELKDLDTFLTKKYQVLVKQVEKHRDEGTAMFAQLVDDEVVDYVKKVPTMGTGVREGNKIIVSKIPYQMKRLLNTKDEQMKRYYLCYCPWIRGAIKDGTEKEISSNFCYCSGGFFKLYWDKIFDQSVEVEPLKTALWGDLVCKFAIEIPEEIMKEYTQEQPPKKEL